MAVVLTLVQRELITYIKEKTNEQYKQLETQQIQIHILQKHTHITYPIHTHTQKRQNSHVHTLKHYKITKYTQ